jgi:hypothetical protein
MTDLSPASQKLLREIARHDQRDGTAAKYLSYGRYTLDPGSGTFNRATFRVLFEHDLILGWDKHDADGLLRLTDAGRKVVAELEAQQVAKKPRPKPSADGPTALRLLREIAKLEKPTLIYSDGRRRSWSLGRDGHRASIDTWLALSSADLIHIEYGFSGGKHVSITDAGRKRLAGPTTP